MNFIQQSCQVLLSDSNFAIPSILFAIYLKFTSRLLSPHSSIARCRVTCGFIPQLDTIDFPLRLHTHYPVPTYAGRYLPKLSTTHNNSTYNRYLLHWFERYYIYNFSWDHICAFWQLDRCIRFYVPLPRYLIYSKFGRQVPTTLNL